MAVSMTLALTATVTLFCLVALLALSATRVDCLELMEYADLHKDIDLSSNLVRRNGEDDETRRTRELHRLNDLVSKDKSDKTKVKSRKKRATLYWPEDSQFVAEFYFTIPISAPSGVSIPFTIDVPYKFTLPNVTSNILGRGKANSKNTAYFSERLDVYGVVEGIFEKFGMNGKACMLRAVCERAESHLVEAGMLGEVITTILAASSASSSDDIYEYQTAEYYGKTHGDCWNLYPGCPMSLFNWIE
ncbi:uncharacterized protein LOC125043963 [Penaeus chinensis]|uniref:uncharacterized protein LOC125043963 n=1 Tax=Penaeus chinensis TaxID=139456 RepID=UPI001FB740A0|nr:uncharacterized protein LOC125043963 [Penaeus chinensis]XP_047496326.1 uncharacterized protein LOC125043963 [Penaeus chinensis]XP_047496327.1 uncharacterized protein LOC125043963 [Penaeus chinensis]